MEKFLKKYALLILLYVVIVLGGLLISNRLQVLQLASFLIL